MISSTSLQYLSAQVYWPPAASGHTARLDSAASSHTDRGGNRLHGHQHLYRHDHHYLVTQLDDLFPLYWDLCIDHLYFQHPESTEI